MKLGDKVAWTHTSTRGRTMSMRLREGVIEAIRGDVAIVKTKAGRRADVALVRLRLDGEPSQIGEFVGAMREAHRDA